MDHMIRGDWRLSLYPSVFLVAFVTVLTIFQPSELADAVYVSVAAATVYWGMCHFVAYLWSYQETWNSVARSLDGGAGRRLRSHHVCFFGIPSLALCLSTGGLIAITVLHATRGFSWSVPILWGIFPVCCGGCLCWCWCWKSSSDIDQLFKMEIKREARQHTIVFEGSVLPGKGKPCVCSWPGKLCHSWVTFFAFLRVLKPNKE